GSCMDRRSSRIMGCIAEDEQKLFSDFDGHRLRLKDSGQGVCLAQLKVSSSFKTSVQRAQADDQKFQEMVKCIGNDNKKELRYD
ncbi:hypothetical protein PIB30_101366, partial [Stylosanthes scabra]|nr:hypothetical protein [Stylosanthes scabra]